MRHLPRHFEKLKGYLDALGIEYTVDPDIVRGLDYYTKTVFEITSDDLGAQSAVCGGGRYNGLIEELGGKPTPGIGFALGIERIMMILKSQGISLGEPETPDIFIAAIGEKADMAAQKLVYSLRALGAHAERDLCLRSVKAQMKYANKLNAKFSIVLGDDEIDSGKAAVKNMSTGETLECGLEPGEIFDIIKQSEG